MIQSDRATGGCCAAHGLQQVLVVWRDLAALEVLIDAGDTSPFYYCLLVV
jgi:hypothetical protein